MFLSFGNNQQTSVVVASMVLVPSTISSVLMLTNRKSVRIRVRVGVGTTSRRSNELDCWNFFSLIFFRSFRSQFYFADETLQRQTHQMIKVGMKI